MTPGPRGPYRIAAGVFTAIVVALIAAQHLTAQLPPPPNWVSSGALGDVAVSFDSFVEVRNNADGGLKETLTSGLTGTNGGLIYDDPLNLLVAHTVGNQLVKFAPQDTGSGHPSVPIDTQDAPRALAIAKDGTVYVASLTTINNISTAIIRRIDAAGACAQTETCPEFTVPTDSATNVCIGIDLDDQNTMYFVSGGRTVKSVANVNTASGDIPLQDVSVFANLNGNGVACGLRVLAPVDVRTLPPIPPPPPTPLVGGVVVADQDSVRLVRASGQTTFNLSGNKNIVDVAVDSKGDIWAVNAGTNNLRLVRYRIGNPNPQVTITLTSAPRGVAINGEQRYAQTIRNVALTTMTQEGEALFLETTPYKHAWRGKMSSPTSLAVQAIEVRPEPKVDEVPGTNSVCPPSLYIDCRLSLFNPSRLVDPPPVTPKTYSRNRSVFYREILRTLPPDGTLSRITIIFPAPTNETDESAGQFCVVGVPPNKASALLRDPWEPNVFSFDPTWVFSGGDDGITTRTITKTNDNIIVERDADNYMRIIRPVVDGVDSEGRPVATIQLKRSLPIAVEVRRPSDCSFVDFLEQRLVLSVVDITQGVDAIIGDSVGANGTLAASGGIFAKTASEYRTNLAVKDPPYKFGHTYRVCITAGAAELLENPSGIPANPLAAEACRDVLVN
jgi:hypothetical protein